jgi:hypothetical protein
MTSKYIFIPHQSQAKPPKNPASRTTISQTRIGQIFTTVCGRGKPNAPTIVSQKIGKQYHARATHSLFGDKYVSFAIAPTRQRAESEARHKYGKLLKKPKKSTPELQSCPI